MARKRPAPRSPWRRRLGVTIKILLALAVLALGALVVAVYVARAQLPSFEELKSSPNGQMIRVHAADGALVAEYARERRLYIPIQAVPKLVINAFLAAEDKNFYDHGGLDFGGILRAVVNYAQNFGSYNETYGSLGAVIGFMTWLWISVTIVLVGAEINAEAEHQTEADTTKGPEQPMGHRGAVVADSPAPQSS